MEDVREPSDPSGNGSQDAAPEEKKKHGIRGISRRLRSGFSDVLSSLVEDDKGDKDKSEKSEKSDKADKAEQSTTARGVPDTIPEELCSTSEESLEPESPYFSPKARMSLDGEPIDQNAAALHWRGFMKLLKIGPPSIRLPHKSQLKNVPKLTRRKSKRIRDDMVPTLSTPLDADLGYFKSSWRNFSLSELQEATNNYSQDCLIGQGGYAEVYKGKLQDGQYVAIKRLARGSPEEMTIDFLSELGIMVHVDHPNIAKVLGYGVEGGMHLVLQLSPHGSLASLLYGPKELLNWEIRFRVASGTAEGLSYLHVGCQRRIIHKDIKAANILLTEDFGAQISDFGLAKWLPDQWTHHTVSQIEGTFGYLPPEFFMHGIVDEKTDVYAYGVLLLELITGKQALDSSQQSLVMWAKPLIDKNRIKDLVDPTIWDGHDPDQLNCLISVASMCINPSSLNRPQMTEVVDILKGDVEKLETLKKRQNVKLQRTYSEELLDAQEYNSTKYLNDLHHHMEELLENEHGELDTPTRNDLASPIDAIPGPEKVQGGK